MNYQCINNFQNDIIFCTSKSNLQILNKFLVHVKQSHRICQCCVTFGILENKEIVIMVYSCVHGINKIR